MAEGTRDEERKGRKLWGGSFSYRFLLDKERVAREREKVSE